MKKNQFESDLVLSTGRFEDGASVDGVQKENFSKSANQAKVLRIMQEDGNGKAPPVPARLLIEKLNGTPATVNNKQGWYVDTLSPGTPNGSSSSTA